MNNSRSQQRWRRGDIRCRLLSRRGRRASSQDLSVPLLPADNPKQQNILGQDAVQRRVLDVIRLHPAELYKLVEAEREGLQEVPFGRGIWRVSECSWEPGGSEILSCARCPSVVGKPRIGLLLLLCRGSSAAVLCRTVQL